MFEFADDTALLTPFSRLSRPTPSLRMTRLTARMAKTLLPPKFSIMVGQYTNAGAA